MAPIQTFSVRIVTGDRPNAGTDGDVYIGLCGREFYIDSEKDSFNDFERASDTTYIFGAGHNVRFHEVNDPRSDYPIDTEDVELADAYIRLVPIGQHATWNLEDVEVSINNGAMKLQAFRRDPPGAGPSNLWLGIHAGLVCNLWISRGGIVRGKRTAQARSGRAKSGRPSRAKTKRKP
jgi:hypothetical protein